MKQAATVLVAWLVIAAAPDAPKQAPGIVTMTQEQQRTVGLQTVRAERRPISEPIRAPGTIAFDQGHVAILRPLAPARVVNLLVQLDDEVRAGRALATLDIPSLVTAEENLASARASAHEAEAGAAVARAALRRGELLARDGSLARAEVDRRRLALVETQATEQAARDHVTALQTLVKRLDPSGDPGAATLTTPISGVVVTIGVTPGELIDTTTDSFTVADPSVVVALAQVPEGSATMVAVGDQAVIRTASDRGRSWKGRVSALAASLDPRARTLPARITLDNQDRALRAGMFVEATITSHRGRDDVTVPATAVQFVGDKRVVFTPLGGNRFQARDLTLGVQQPDWVEVDKGLSPGDEVVTQGSFALKSLLQEAMLGGGG